MGDFKLRKSAWMRSLISMREPLSGEATKVFAGNLAYSFAIARDPLPVTENLINPALPVKVLECFPRFAPRKLLDFLL